MTAAEIAQIAGAVAALLASGGWAARLGLRATEQRKLLAEARLAEVTAGDMVTTSAFAEWREIVLALREEVNRLRVARDEVCRALEAAEQREEALEKRLRKALRDIEELKERVRRPGA